MNILYEYHQQFLKNLKPRFTRQLLHQIDWSNRMIGVKGARGVGKSTLILQHIQTKFGEATEALYVSIDHLQILGISLLDIADHHYKIGGTHLFIDEIHKSPGWSRELKVIYDLYSTLFIVFTSSSILEIYKGQSDLSRRVLLYELNGLSFREYLQIEYDTKLPILPIEDLMLHHTTIAHDVLTEKLKPLKYFNAYLRSGYYPFYLENKDSYSLKLLNIINHTLEQDIHTLYGLDSSSVIKLKKLLHVLSVSVPFQPNIAKLAGAIEISKNTLFQYLECMRQGKLISLLLDQAKSYSLITKPEKIYLHNPNLIYSLSPTVYAIGNVRETFFLNQLTIVAKVNSSKHGDFLVNDKYSFEIRGQNKNFDQIANIPNSFIAADDIEIGSKNKIPLWLFGFLY